MFWGMKNKIYLVDHKYFWKYLDKFSDNELGDIFICYLDYLSY